MGILYRTTIGARGRNTHALPGHRLFQRLRDVISRSRNIVQVSGWLIVDRTVVNQNPIRINDKHMRGGFGSIEMTKFTGGIQQDCRGGSFHSLDICILLIRRHISLLAGSRGDYSKPDDSPARPFTLKFLHISALVMLAGERTFAVMPLKHHKLTLVFR